MRYFLSILLISSVCLAGCSVKTYTLEKQRVDTLLEGNQGYLSGNPPSEADKKESSLGDTRKVAVMEVEFGSSSHKYGCKGKSIKEDVSKESIYEEESYQTEEIDQIQQPETVRLPKVASKEGEWYTVQKSDTLQKISYKFYNTTKKWLLVFEKNKDILKSPDKIYPGMKIKIPAINQ